MAESVASTRPAGVTAFWSGPAESLLAATGSALDGLTEAEATQRLARDGPNTLEPPRRHRTLRLFVSQFASPILLILVAATILSMALGDATDGGIILAIIAASGLLGFWQERSAGEAVDALLEQVRIETTVVRDGTERSIPVEEVVVGDVVALSAGNVVPADSRVLDSQELLVDESALTGESFPVEKEPGEVAANTPPSGRTNALFMGTHVVSGTGRVLVAATGRRTAFGEVSQELGTRPVSTGFERGITAFGLLLVRAMLVLVTAIFVINLLLHRPVVDSFLFSLALAVGLTPQLLPAIVSISLATGARKMAQEHVIVRRLDAIEDFGAMTILCTDKTGTITSGALKVGGAFDLGGVTSGEVLRLASVNAALQHGFPNPLDQAILAEGVHVDRGALLAEVPYDFERKRLSVLARGHDTPLLITKGAFDTVLAVCATAEIDDEERPIETVRDDVHERYRSLSADGFRVLALATKPMGGDHATLSDEAGMTLRGLLAFLDPPKEGAPEAIRQLADDGVSIRIISGDNRLAAAKVAADVGLDANPVVTGAEIDDLDDEALAARVGDVAVLAEIEPLQKERIIQALRANDHVVGFLGDGINDAAALHAADVGISVNTAVDVAKRSAAIVLLDKSLAAVADGVRLGRQTFANTLKYIRVTTSANFGNMLSMAIAAVFLPFLPLLPRQILLLNFLTDIPGLTIARDEVDAEQLERPRAWNLRSIRTFMIVYGLISSVFDILTFIVLRVAFHADEILFRSAWFIGSTITELAVMLVLRTNRRFYRSKAGTALLVSSAATAILTIVLPYSPLAEPLGLDGLPLRVLATLVGLAAAYVAVNEAAKRRYPPAT